MNNNKLGSNVTHLKWLTLLERECPFCLIEVNEGSGLHDEGLFFLLEFISQRHLLGTIFFTS